MSDASEGDTVSEWGNDAAVYSSQSDLSEWEASDAESADSIDVLNLAAPGELPLTSTATA